MNIWSRLKNAMRRSPAPPASNIDRRNFSAAQYSRLTASMEAESEYINRTLRYQGKTLRARARQLARNNAYAAKFLTMCVENICGPQPFRLQAKAKNAKGKLDDWANRKIEAEWQRWGQATNCDLAGRLTWSAMQRLIVRNLACDGEALILLADGSGPYGLQLQVVDVDRLDEDKNEQLTGGRVIVAGIEYDQSGKTLAYHLLRRKAQTWETGITRDYDRVKANRILHLFVSDFAEQHRGIPWMYAAMLQLNQLGAFEEAAVIAARVGASKMGFYTTPDLRLLDSNADAKDVYGRPVQDAEPGHFDMLPPGVSFQTYDPAYPDAAVGPFIKSCLRGVSAALGVSYHSLANDLESVNFSSARAGVLEERERWMALQTWLADNLQRPIYERWLGLAILTGKLPFKEQEKYREVTFRPRRWAWVDPLKDINANIEAIKWGIKSRTAVVEESGGDLEDVFAELAAEHEQAETVGIEINPDTVPLGQAPTEIGDRNDDTEDHPPSK